MMRVGLSREPARPTLSELVMTTVPLDSNVIAALVESKRLVAISDAAGQVVGFFAPVELEHAPQYAAGAAQLYPHKDAHKATDDGKRYTTAEVLQHLESLEKQ
jgi:hypothetical protein